MVSAGFFASSKVLIVAGKGGVGKTTVGMALGIAASQAGFDTVLIELEANSRIGQVFSRHQLTYDETVLLPPGTMLADTEVTGQLRGRKLTPEAALSDYLTSNDVGRIASRFASSGMVDLIATAAPGIRDVLLLGKIRQMVNVHHADVIIVDAPAAGHALSFLRSPAGLAAAAPSGPVRDQADQASSLITDPELCQAILVTLAEETPVSELIDTAYTLEDEINLNLGPIVANRVIPPVPGLAGALAETAGKRATNRSTALRAAAQFRLKRMASQKNQLSRLTNELPLPLLTLPHRYSPSMNADDIGHLAASLARQLPDPPRQP